MIVEVHRRTDWKILLTDITGSVEQARLLRNEYLVTENRILRHQIQGRVRLNDGERQTLAEIGQRLGKQVMAMEGRFDPHGIRARLLARRMAKDQPDAATSSG